MIEVEVDAVVNPTELEERVVDSIENIFEGLELDVSEQLVTGHGGIECLQKLHSLIREEEIIDSAHKEFRKGLSHDGLSTYFIVSKQVATVGRLNFPARPEPLGSINVDITASSSSELERLFEWLVPPTERGVPEFEIDIKDVEE